MILEIRHRLRRYSIAFFLCTFATTVWAQPGKPTRHWILDGTELIDALEGKLDGATHDGDIRRALSSSRAHAYIAGVADASGGDKWCGQGAVLPHELTDRTYTYLRSLAPERLKQNASTLVIEALEKAFPCPDR